jgi:hypothetical protein
VEVRNSTHVSYLPTCGRRQRTTDPGERGDINRRQPFVARRGTLGSLLSVGILCFTVATALAIGILSAYASVIAILHSFASQSRGSAQEKPVLASAQARAAHAGAD